MVKGFALFCFLLFPFLLFAGQDTVIVRSGHIDPQGIFKLVYVPVELPAGVKEIRVRESYTYGNVLNMGIYGPEGYKPGNTAGFRGWSGGAKNEFYISGSSASTGYIPGKIKAGTWNILIYPSNVITKGLDWKLEITLSFGKTDSLFQVSPAKTVISHLPGWYRGDLHMHTLHSDGKRTQQELVNEALEKKLDYIISTEHNTNSANQSWGKYDNNKLLIINGEEVTTTAYGHWNAIGINTGTYIDWRYAPDDHQVEKYIDLVHRDGGLAIINHPFYANLFLFDATPFDGIEIWNGSWDKDDERALHWWDEFLQHGKKKIAIGASDTHKNNPYDNNLGQPQTVVYAGALSRNGILSGLKKGNVYIAVSNNINLSFTASCNGKKSKTGEVLNTPAGQTISVSLAASFIPDAELTLHSDQGIIARENSSEKPVQWTLKPGTARYIRVEIRAKNGTMLALTNPIWLNN